jgi:predicted membrane channel-forming protein YqfA (hemolysin III family)
MIFTVIGIAVLAIIGFWFFGGVALRVAGIVFVLVGLISLVALANPAALLMVAIGLLMWLAGHWHFALRHHEYKSPLAERIFLQVLPPRYDPTRNWGTSVISEAADPDRSAAPTPPGHHAYPDERQAGSSE